MSARCWRELSDGRLAMAAQNTVCAAAPEVKGRVRGEDAPHIAMLEKMKAKVEEEESLAQAYGELSDDASSLDEQIEEALAVPEEAAGADSLAALKAKMGIG